METRYEEDLLQALLEKGLLSLERAQEVLMAHKDSGRPAAEIMVETGALTEDVLIAFLARAVKTAPIDVTKFPLRRDLSDMVSPELMRESRVMPMEKVGSSLTLAMVNPFDERAKKDVAKATGLRVKVVVTGPNMLEQRLSEIVPPREPHPREDVEDGRGAPAAPRPAFEGVPRPVKAKVIRRAPEQVPPPVRKPSAAPGPPAAAPVPPAPHEPEEEIVLSPVAEIERRPLPSGPARAIPDFVPPEPDEVLEAALARYSAPTAEKLPEHVLSLFGKRSGRRKGGSK